MDESAVRLFLMFTLMSTLMYVCTYPDQDSGWWSCLALAVGSPDPVPGSETVELHLALRNLLPVPLHLGGGVRFTLVDEVGEWEVSLTPGRGTISGRREESSEERRQEGNCGGSGALSEDEAAAGRTTGAAGADRGPSLTDASAASPGGAMTLRPGGYWERAAVQVTPMYEQCERKHTSSQDPASPVNTLSPHSASFNLPPHHRCTGKLEVKRVTLALSDVASVSFRGPACPPSGSGAAAPSSLGGLHTLLALPPPFSGVGGVKPGE